MKIKNFFDPATFTHTYVVWDESTKDAVVIDPVLDYDPLASQTSTETLETLDAFLQSEGLKLKWVLETHAHADHLSGSQWLRRKYDAGIAVGEKITDVQETFKTIFDLPKEFAIDGSQFDKLLKDGETFSAGSLKIKVMSTPGHTPACVTLLIDDVAFVGDTLLMDDYGTGRCDFPKGSADDMYASLTKLYALPDDTRIFIGHDYPPNGRDVMCETTIAKSKANNPHMKAETTRKEYVALRTARDQLLKPPRLIFQSVQVNIDAGKMPGTHGNGIRYLRTPLNLFGPTDDVGEKTPTPRG